MALRNRTISVLTGSALLVPLLSLGTTAFAAGEATPPPPQSTAQLCRNVPAGYQPFTDIAGNTFEQTIECLAFAAVTRGGPGSLPPSQYGPALTVSRDAMASFIARLIDKADELDTGDSIRALPAFDGSQRFSDVRGNVHAESIDRLAEAGIVQGGPGGRPADRYVPEEGVSRAQMASFVRRALEYMTGDRFSTPSDYFSDDENAQPHVASINAVAAEGIAVGDGRDAYQPAAVIRRDQMSGFLTRTLAVLEADGDVKPVS